MAAWQQLRELDLSGNQLTSLPEGMCSLPRLEVRGAQGCKRAVVPAAAVPWQRACSSYLLRACRGAGAVASSRGDQQLAGLG